MNKDLIEKYFNGTATPKETRMVLKWFKTPEGKDHLDIRLTNDLENLNKDKILFSREINTNKILGNIFDVEKIATAKHFYSSVIFKVAAAIAFVFISFVAVMLVKSFQYKTFTTTFGEKKEIWLPDSSLVVLNGNSELKIPSRWSEAENREVWIKGEGFFNVVHTRNHNKFTVHTEENLEIQVLGTEFNVRTRNNITRVSLEKGKIKLSIEDKGKTSEVVMTPGEVVEFNEQSSYLIKKETKTEHISSWKNAKMKFDQVSLLEISLMLEETYGLKLIIDDPKVLKLEITGTVPNNNIESLLKGLAEILNVNIERENGLIYMKKK
jgi:transmembrane sensor